MADDEQLRRALADIILECSQEELVEWLGAEEFESLADEGRRAVERVLAEAGAGFEEAEE